MIENRVDRHNKNEEESYLSQEEAYNNTHLFVCEICGTNMPLKEKEDHLLCHEIESEERKNDIIINVSPNGEIEQNSQNKYSKFFLIMCMLLIIIHFCDKRYK